RSCGCDFKKCRVGIPISNEIAKYHQAIGNCVLGNHFAIDTNTFAKRDEVRRSEKTGAISVCAQNRINHGTNGAFAIRPSDVNHSASPKIDMQLGDKSPNIFQAKLNSEALKAIEPGERLCVRWKRSRHFPPWREQVHGATAK